ncbi:MAG: radical SAM protein [Bdellovibrio sp.]
MNQKMMSLDFPNIVKWYITGKCNLRCKHCYLTDYTKETPLEKILPVLDYLAQQGTRHIYFLGGEPLLRKDFDLILEKTHQLGLHTIVATNAILLSIEKARLLKKLGLGSLQISLDSPAAETHESIRGKGTFAKTIEGIKNAKAANLTVKLAFVANSFNYHQISELIVLAAELEIDLVRIMPLIPVGTAATNSYLKLNPDIIKRIQQQINSGKKAHPKMKIVSGLDEALPTAPTSPFGCGAGTSHLIINSDLTLSACDLGTEVERTAQPISLPEEIKTTWNHHPIFTSWRSKEPAHCHLGRTAYPGLPYF